MLKKLLFFSIYILILALSAWLIKGFRLNLFEIAPWALIASVILGITLGVARAKRAIRSRTAIGQGERHTIASFLEHWGTAAGIFILIFSGYQVYSRSGGLFSINLHFLGLFFTLVFGCYFLADFLVSKKYDVLLPSMKDIVLGTMGKYFMRWEWRDRGKYLASQKSSFLVFLIIGSEIIITGAIKLVAFFWNLPFDIVEMSTSVHDVAGLLFVLLLLVHLLLVITVRSHRPLIRSWFTGKNQEGHSEVDSEADSTGVFIEE